MIRKQRTCYTAIDSYCNDGRDSYQAEPDEYSNSCNFSSVNPIPNLLWNLGSYNVPNNEFLSQGRYSRIFNPDDVRPYTGLNDTNSTNGNNHFGLSSYLQPYCGGLNYESFYNAMGDQSDYFAHGIFGTQQRQTLSNAQHCSDLNDNEDGVNSDYNGSHMNSFPLIYITEPHLTVSPFGTVFLLLSNLIRIDISPITRNVYITNNPGGCVAVLCPGSDKNSIIHPNGRVLREGDTFHIQTEGKCAKICDRGIVFSASNNALRYLVDASGTKSTSEKFNDLAWDFSFQLFFGNSNKIVDDWLNTSCYSFISDSKFKSYNDGNKTWIVGGIRIKQDRWGETSVAVNNGQVILKTSPTVNFISISSPFYSMSINCHPVQHVYVRKGNKSVTVGKKFLSVQNGSQRAGFDKNNRLVLH